MINLEKIPLNELEKLIEEQEKNITKEMKLKSYKENDIGIYDKKGNLIGTKEDIYYPKRGDMLMNRKNRYLDELGIPRKIYCGNFVRERKFYRLLQRYRYGFDYRDIFNMDVSFAEWLYSHMRMYKDNSVHDDTMHNIVFEEDEYTIEESVDWIIEKIGAFLKYSYYIDAHFDYKTNHPVIGKLICKYNPSVRLFLEEYDWSECNECQIEEDYIKAGRLFLEIMGYCWM